MENRISKPPFMMKCLHQQAKENWKELILKSQIHTLHLQIHSRHRLYIPFMQQVWINRKEKLKHMAFPSFLLAHPCYHVEGQSTQTGCNQLQTNCSCELYRGKPSKSSWQLPVLRFWELNRGQRKGYPSLLSHITKYIATFTGTVRAWCMGTSPTERSSGNRLLIKSLEH